MRLHLKVFLWFWLGVVVVSGTLIGLTELTHSRAEDDRLWREKYSPRVDLWARQETHILRTKGSGALEEYVGSFQSDPGVLNYMFDAGGREVFDRTAPQPVVKLVTSMTQASGWTQRVDPAERIIAERIIDANGNANIVVVDFPLPSVLSQSLFDLFSADFSSGRPTRASVVRLSAVVIVAGIFCFVLARHIAGPIDRLRSATRKIASEQLEARIDRGVLNRRDELADLGHDFNRMADRIEDLVTAQRHLLSDVSHALRSPLARLNVALGLARRHSAPDAGEHLDRIELETERLNTLIGQLLTMARVDSGVEVEGRSTFDLAAIVDEVAMDADYEARSRRCTVQASGVRDCLVEGAPDMLRGAIENVVRNAVRHTADGTSVDISLDRHDVDGRPRAVIQVRDHGPGVPDKMVPRLFVPFYRGTNGNAENGNGTGLGLAITKRVFEVHGGTATATNAEGGGFVVSLELPLRIPGGRDHSHADDTRPTTREQSNAITAI
jgi:two-component system sensor histidine kinase CpxA